MDTQQLNSQLTTIQQGHVCNISGQVVSASKSGPLYIPVQIPANVDLEFDGITFSTDIHFQQRLNGRLIFKDCIFQGIASFSNCSGGFVGFYGVTIFCIKGIEVRNCSNQSIYILGSQAQVSIGPQTNGISEASTFNILNMEFSQNNGLGLNIENIAPELNLFSNDCGISNCTIRVSNISNLSFTSCRIRSLQLDWEQIFGLAFYFTEIESLNIPIDKVLQIPVVKSHPLCRFIDWKTLELIANIQKNSGNINDFVSLFCRSGEARLLEEIKKIKMEINSIKLDKKINYFTRFRIIILNYIKAFPLKMEQFFAIKYFKRFFSIFPILLTQLGILVLFSLIYFLIPGVVESAGQKQISSFFDAFYFSGISFFTIGFGDLVPTGILRFVVLLQGFLGLVSNAGLAVVLARRYST